MSLIPNFKFSGHKELLDIRNYRTAGIYRIFTGKFLEKFFFCIFVNSVVIKVFEVADSDFYGFRFSTIMVFPYYREIPNLPWNTEFTVKFWWNFFFAFRSIKYYSRFSTMLILNLTVFASFPLCFSRLP